MRLQKREYSSGRKGPHLLITGGVHGDEFAPMATVRRLIRDLDNSTRQLQCGRLTLVPVVNEAAFLRGHRCADDGLDLARVCPGDAEGSITLQTANALSQLIESADYYIDLHTGGTAFSVLPLAGYSLHNDGDILVKQREMARAFNLRLVWGTSAELDGRSLSVARDACVPAIYTEYHGSGGYDPNAVDAYHAGCLNVMGWLKMIDRQIPPPLVEYVVEDPRPASGHLQIRNPAPMGGFFEPAVRLGDPIRRGDLLGTVSDPLGRSVHEIISDQDGLILVLRNFSLVSEGESVGVVLELPASERAT